MYGIYVWRENADGVRANVVRMTGTREDAKHIAKYFIRLYGYHMNVITGGQIVFTF